MTSPTSPSGPSGFGPAGPEPGGYSAAAGAPDPSPAPALHHAYATNAPTATGPWRWLTSVWLTYPVGYGLIGVVLGVLVMINTDSTSPVVTTLAGTGFAVLALAVYGVILVGLQALVHPLYRIRPEGIGKLVWFLGTIVFAGLTFATCLVLSINPLLLTVAAIFAGLLAVRLGQWLVGFLTERRAVTAACLVGCVVLVVVSFAMLPATLAAT